MKSSSFLLAAAFATPLALTGCGNTDSAAKVTFMHHDKYAVEVGEGSDNVTTLPFYMEGSKTLSGLDADINTDTTAGQARLRIINDATVATVTFTAGKSTADAAKDLATKTGTKAKAIMFSTQTAITMTGSKQQLAGVKAYVLTIVQGSVSHEIGVVRALNGQIYTFNAEEVKAGAKPVLRTLASNKIDVSSRTRNADNTFKSGTGDRYLDYSVNVPTTVDNQLAPYSGLVGCTKLVLSGTTNTYRLVKDEGEAIGDTTVTATDGVFTSADQIVFDWLQDSVNTQALQIRSGSTNVNVPVGTTFSRFVKSGSVVPGAYWKAGYGFVECIGRVNDDKVFVAEGFTSADGELREATFTAGTTTPPVTPNTASKPIVQVTFTEFNPNQDPTKFAGFFVADYILPRGVN